MGDADGVIVIRPEDAESVADAAEAVIEKEEQIMRDILEKRSYIRPWVDQKIQELGTEIVK